MIDHFFFMKIPNFKIVFKWRLLQEDKLRKKSHLNKKIMSYNKIKRFIMFYERITLQMLKDLSKSASVFILLKPAFCKSSTSDFFISHGNKVNLYE